MLGGQADWWLLLVACCSFVGWWWWWLFFVGWLVVVVVVVVGCWLLAQKIHMETCFWNPKITLDIYHMHVVNLFPNFVTFQSSRTSK